MRLRHRRRQRRYPSNRLLLGLAAATVLVPIVGTAAVAGMLPASSGRRVPVAPRGLRAAQQVRCRETTLTPQLSVVAAAPPAAVPGDRLRWRATVTHSGGRLEVHGRLSLSQRSGDATLSGYTDVLSRQRADGRWEQLGAVSASWRPGATPAVAGDRLTLTARRAARHGSVQLRGGDLLLGTVLHGRAGAAWEYVLTDRLSAAQVQALRDGRQTREALRNELTLRVSGPRGPYAVSTPTLLYDPSQRARSDLDQPVGCAPEGSRADASDDRLIGAAAGSPDLRRPELTVQAGRAPPVTVPLTRTVERGELDPGQSATVTGTVPVPRLAPRGRSETSTAYLTRLRRSDRAPFPLLLTATARTTTGAPVASPPARPAIRLHLPVLVPTKAGPPTAAAGAPLSYTISVVNRGSLSATGVRGADRLPDGTGQALALDTRLAPARSAAVSVPFTAPATAGPTSLTDTASLTWSDRNSNRYGPVDAAFTTALTPGHAAETLTLARTGAGPLVTGATVDLTAVLTSADGTPLAGQRVDFGVTGVNPQTGQGTTDASGTAHFAYAGAHNGTDTVQASSSQPGGLVQSGTVSVDWIVPVTTVSTTSVLGRFFAGGQGAFSHTPADPEAFRQTFPTIDFNPPAGTIPHDRSGVGVDTRPFTDVTTDDAGNYTGSVVAQGNGLQAGNGDLFSFDAVFTADFVVAAAGDVTFNFFSDDGFILGVGGGATRVSGVQANVPPSGMTPFESYSVMGAYNGPTAPVGNSITVHFPAPGTYPYEVDYSECCGGQDALTMATSDSGHGVAPAGNLALTPTNLPAQPVGSSVRLTLAAMDAGGHPIPDLPVTGTVTGPNEQRLTGTTDAAGLATLSYTGRAPGLDQVEVGASVAGIPAISNIVPVTWDGSGSPAGPAPTVTDLSPADGSVVTVPSPVRAHVEPPPGETVASWVLTEQALDPQPPVTIASGMGTPPDTLATFDPTMLPNDTYALALTVTSSGGGTRTGTTTVAVAGNFKPGRYVATYQDLSVPVDGYTMQVQRRYDSTDKSSGDFGAGWHLGLTGFRVAANRVLGAGGWTQYDTSCFGALCLTGFRSSTSHFVTVTWPDGHQELFDFTPGGGSVLFDTATPAFTARPGTGTTSTLEPLEGGSLDYQGDGNLYAGGQPYDPTRFRLTTHDGRVLILDTASGLVSQTDRNGRSLTVDASGVHSSSGPSLTFARDGSGRIVAVDGPGGAHLGYGYSGAGDLASVTAPNGGVTSYHYDGAHDLTGVTGPDGRPQQALQYGPDGRLAAVTDAAGNTTRITDDVPGRQQTVLDANGKRTVIDTFDDLGDLLRHDEVADGTTRTSRYSYDGEGRLLTSTDPTGAVTHSVWDARGDLLGVTDPLGRTATYTYDGFGALRTVTDATGTVQAALDYDSTGNPVAVHGPGGYTASATYQNGRVTQVTDSQGHQTGYGYDAAGRLVQVTDALGHTRTRTVDDQGRTLAVTDPNGAVTHYDYDADGNIVSVTDAAGNATAYRYDELDRMVSATDRLGHTTTYGYDAGRLTTTTDRAGVTTTYLYDADGQPVRQTLSSGERTTWSYDGFEQLRTTANETATLGYTHDAAGRVLTESVTPSHSGALPATTEAYTYDAGGAVTSTTGPGGTTRQGYDAAGRLATVTDPTGSVFALGYDAASRATSLHRANGVTDALGYNPDGTLASLTSGLSGQPPLLSGSYGYDTAFHRTSADGGTYGYDPTGQLTSAPGETFGYDSRGNRATPGAGYDAGDRLLGDGTSTYTYDAEGRLTSRRSTSTGALTSYTWNGRGELTSVRLPGDAVTAYAYDPLGRRVSVDASGRSTRYAYDGADIVAEFDGNNALAASFVDLPGVDHPLEMRRGGRSYSYVLDGRGDVAALTDDRGNAVDRYSYDAFGRPARSTVTVANPFTFAAREYDPSTGLVFDRARYYDPALGRFLSEDPVPSVNPYPYVGNNPLGSTDPSGALAVEYQALLANQVQNGTAIANAVHCVGLALVDGLDALNDPHALAKSRADLVGAGQQVLRANDAYDLLFGPTEDQRQQVANWVVGKISDRVTAANDLAEAQRPVVFIAEFSGREGIRGAHIYVEREARFFLTRGPAETKYPVLGPVASATHTWLSPAWDLYDFYSNLCNGECG